MKWIAVIAVAACALIASLYATAAPDGTPLRAQMVRLQAQMTKVQAQMTKVQTRLTLAELWVSQLQCQRDYAWPKFWIVNETVRASLVAGDSTFAPTFFPKAQLPFKLPDCI
jgi:hypothetical protein